MVEKDEKFFWELGEFQGRLAKISEELDDLKAEAYEVTYPIAAEDMDKIVLQMYRMEKALEEWIRVYGANEEAQEFIKEGRQSARRR